MQRRIERADGDRKAVHRFKHTHEVLALHGQQLLEGCPAIFFIRGQNHCPHVSNAIRSKEHVFGSAQSDALGAKGSRLDSIARNVSVGTHAQPTVRVRPAHEFEHLGVIGGWRQSVEPAFDHATGSAV